MLEIYKLAKQSISENSTAYISQLKNAIDEINYSILSSYEKTVVDACNKFIRSIKISQLFNEPSDEIFNELKACILAKPRLVILMRSDIGSLNPGKAIAQGTHAANQMVYEAMLTNNENLQKMVAEWSREGVGFGTCIVLGANERQMRASVASAKNAGLHAGITHDPTYPVKDGDTFYTIPMDTCAYIFDYQAVVRPHVSELSLMP